MTLANALTAFRVIAAPVLIILALANQPSWLLMLLTASFLTDAADGAVARMSGGPTNFGAKFDSIADAIAYTAIGVSIILLWPDTVRREMVAFVAVAASLFLPAILALIKFGQLTSYHTWLVKLAVGAVSIGLLILLLDWAAWPFRAAAILAVLAGLEEAAITLLLREPRSDVGSLGAVWRNWRSA
ncbi:MAG: CDP-alcohol phosphatidyltransferase family protein [Hyphomicrobiaceae bacterium]